MGFQTHQFGTLYLNDAPKHIPQMPYEQGDVPVYNGKAKISIGDSYDGDTVTWIQPDGMGILIADRVLLVNVSWNDLNGQGFVEGKEIMVDGTRFLCRLLKVGDGANAPNEWDSALNIAGDDNDLWHWADMFSFGQETSRKDTGFRVCRGCNSARWRDGFNATVRNADAGFRPALEPLDSGHLRSEEDVALEGVRFTVVTEESSDIGLRLILWLLAGGGIDGIPAGTRLRMYTVLANGRPVKADGNAAYPDDAKITITDAFYGQEYLVSWVVSSFGGIRIIAEIPLLKNVSKAELKKQGYIS